MTDEQTNFKDLSNKELNDDLWKMGYKCIEAIDWKEQYEGDGHNSMPAPVLERIRRWLSLRKTNTRARILMQEWLSRAKLIPLEPADYVFKCASAIKDLLKEVPIQYLLIAGKIEMPLRLFIGAAWEKSPWDTTYTSSRAYVMDKEFNRAPLDLLALEQSDVNAGIVEPKFWVETKCSIAEDQGDVWKEAKKALNQTRDYADKLNNRTNPQHQAFATCDAYIVHFLTSPPSKDDKLLPPWVMKKFDRLRGPGVGPMTLESYYKYGLAERYDSSKVIPIRPDHRSVDAVVVKLRRGSGV